jgi:MoaA/NifB/PqqE/SkfB family radical SAM enzyme
MQCPLPGCISQQPEESGFPAPQNRIDFLPTPKEILEIMHGHAAHEKRPIFSFGQGCEGEPLTEWKTLAESTRQYRKQGGKGTVNVNTNASMPDAITALAEAGVSSIRVSLNSVRKNFHEAYYRPTSFTFEDVVESMRRAKAGGMFVSLNYLYFPGVSDTEDEVQALCDLVASVGVDFIQLRNMNLDPEIYLDLAAPFAQGPNMGLNNFRKRVKKARPDLGFGYFNPFVG